MDDGIETKDLRRLKTYLHKRIIKGQGAVAHWIWDQPKGWLDRPANRAVFNRKEFSANYLALKYFKEEGMVVPRTPNNFNLKPPSHMLVSRCGNPRCVRPDHQEWVTKSEYFSRSAKRGDDHGQLFFL